MRNGCVLAIALSCLGTAGCSASGYHSTTAPAAANALPAKTAETVSKSLAAIEQKLPAGTRVFATDSVVIHAGDEFAQFPAGARVTRTASGVVVNDVQSGQTFTFPASATLEYTSGTTRAYVPPGESVPGWVKSSHGRVIRAL